MICACRWCSEGGQIYLCDFCPHAFCSKCLRWNLGRKYLKMVEEEEKWKCLICDPSYLREHRALYWAIHKYHKDKKPKGSVGNTSSSPVKQSKTLPTNTQPNQASKASPKPAPVNSVKTNGQMKPQSPGSNKPIPNLKTIETVYKKLRENSDVTVSPVNKNSPSKPGLNLKNNVNKSPAADESKHFVDMLLKDADDCVQQMVYMVGEARKAWKLSGKKPNHIPVVASKLRKALELTKSNIDEVDNKIVEKCFKDSKSNVLTKGKLNGTLTPRKSNVEEKINRNDDEEEGIHDISVDELENAANVNDEIYSTPKKKGSGEEIFKKEDDSEKKELGKELTKVSSQNGTRVEKLEVKKETEDKKDFVLSKDVKKELLKASYENDTKEEMSETNIIEPKDEFTDEVDDEKPILDEVPTDNDGSSNKSEVVEKSKINASNDTGDGSEKASDDSHSESIVENSSMNGEKETCDATDKSDPSIKNSKDNACVSKLNGHSSEENEIEMNVHENGEVSNSSISQAAVSDPEEEVSKVEDGVGELMDTNNLAVEVQ